VDDVVEALFLAATREKLPRMAYNIAGASSLTLAQVSEVVAEMIPGVTVEFGADPFGSQYTIGTVDLSLARAELGYYPQVSLRDGVRRYEEWLRRQ
jgi:nucleoside-diphosphate-sugar epimerase